MKSAYIDSKCFLGENSSSQFASEEPWLAELTTVSKTCSDGASRRIKCQAASETSSPKAITDSVTNLAKYTEKVEENAKTRDVIRQDVPREPFARDRTRGNDLFRHLDRLQIWSIAQSSKVAPHGLFASPGRVLIEFQELRFRYIPPILFVVVFEHAFYPRIVQINCCVNYFYEVFASILLPQQTRTKEAQSSRVILPSFENRAKESAKALWAASVNPRLAARRLTRATKSSLRLRTFTMSQSAMPTSSRVLPWSCSEAAPVEKSRRI